MKVLVIAEKPSAAQSIANAIIKKPIKGDGFLRGDGITVTWAVGHLLSLADPEQYDARNKKWILSSLPIIPEKFKLVPVTKTKKQLYIIKQLAADCTEIVNACDSGREGELIFGYIMQYLRINKAVRRLWTSSLTPDAIRDAYHQMKNGSAYHHLLQAAIARSESDWIIGINGTRAFTAKHGELLSVGRVQTPVLAMLATRQQEIENFKPETYFEVKALFQQGSTNYNGIWQGLRLANKEAADQIVHKVKGKTGVVESYDCKLKKEYPPKLYDLTLLQKEANARYGFTAQKTLTLAQSLYEEHKAITYPRTNSNYVDHTQIPIMHKVFQLLQTRNYVENIHSGSLTYVHSNNKNICRADKIEDHHAILPTDRIPSTLSQDEDRLYQLIVKRFTTHFFPAAEYHHHTVITIVEQEKFKSAIKEELVAGWKVVYNDEKNKTNAEDDIEEKKQFLLDVMQPVFCRNAQAVEKVTSPPKFYTEGTLVAAMQTAGKEIEDEDLRDAMKDHGLGTPATRAGIIERLKKVGYITAKGKLIHVTPKGFALIDIVRNAGVGLLTSPEMTGQWEKRLNEITRGESSSLQFAEQVKKMAHLMVDQVNKQSKIKVATTTKKKQSNSPTSKNTLVIACPATDCTGTIIEGTKGFGCSNWKTGCTFVIWKQQHGKKISQSNVRDLITKNKTNYLKFKSKNSKSYEARLMLIDRQTGKTTLEFKNESSNPNNN